jgi:DNA modification methylase
VLLFVFTGDLLRRFRTRVKELCDPDAERIRERVYVREGDVPLAALDRPDVRAMKTRPPGQLLLGDPPLFAEAPYAMAKIAAMAKRSTDTRVNHQAPITTAWETISLQTMSGGAVQTRIPAEIKVKRSDPIYNAHGYLTKVPVTAIIPFIETFTEPGETVLDLYAGSGMTGVAGAIAGRRVELRDISALGQHIGRNYVNLVEPAKFRQAVRDVIAATQKRLGDVYATSCARCGRPAELSKSTWSKVYECVGCGEPVNYYRALEAAGWRKSKMACAACGELLVIRKARQIREERVLDTVVCGCARTMTDQRPSEPLNPVSLEGLTYPDVAIGADRQMFAASALAKHNLLTTASFFSKRNLAVLAALREEIERIEEDRLRRKLLFAFTAIIARASKRYQWSKKRPLNAANQNYYIAPVFYEWSVYDLFERKSEAVIRSDDFIRAEIAARGVKQAPEVTYTLGSADALDLADESVDYVFTDPPFGSNIFYSDMNLFQEAWLGHFTDHAKEAVVDRSGNGKTRRTAERYENLITGSLRECHRVLKVGGWLSLIFSNSSGEMWGLVQRAIHEAGFSLEAISILDKGQRSVKGLASGFENVVTYDLILSMRKGERGERLAFLEPEPGQFDTSVEDSLAVGARTPSHVYLGVVRDYLRRHLDVTEVDMGHIAEALSERGYAIDAATGKFIESSVA